MSEFKGYGLLDCIGVIFDPRFWLRNERVSREWGELLEAQLDVSDISALGPLYANIGGVKVWIENWPYAYGSRAHSSCLPPRRTAIRLRKAVDSALLSKIKGEAS